MISYKKGSQVVISDHFLSSEFDCHCPCKNDTLIDPIMVSMLEAIRTLAGHGITITSGYRCEDKQKSLRDDGIHTAAGHSTHERGMAADIRIEGLSGEEIEKLARRVGFKAVGVARAWVHVDMRMDKVRRWTY